MGSQHGAESAAGEAQVNSHGCVMPVLLPSAGLLFVMLSGISFLYRSELPGRMAAVSEPSKAGLSRDRLKWLTLPIRCRFPP